MTISQELEGEFITIDGQEYGPYFFRKGEEKILGNAMAALRPLAETSETPCECGGTMRFVPDWNDVEHWKDIDVDMDNLSPAESESYSLYKVTCLNSMASHCDFPRTRMDKCYRGEGYYHCECESCGKSDNHLRRFLD